MSIFANTPRDPLSGPPGFAALDKPPELVRADSAAAKTLTSIIERYCERSITGRSVLIAGHRGAGKTSLVKATIETLRHRKHLLPKAIPLYVQIHGPDLLSLDGSMESPPAKAASGEATSMLGRKSLTPHAVSAAETTRHKGEDEQIKQSLRVLTTALHHAFMNDLSWAFENAASAAHKTPKEQADLRRLPADVPELAAQLRLDLDDLVETDHLRWLWHRTRRLAPGVLRRTATEQQIANDYFSRQGLLEIVAATCVSDAFMRAVAKVKDQDTNKQEAELQRSQEIAKTKDAKERLHALAGIVSGGVAGGGVILSSLNPVGKALLAGLAFTGWSVVTTTLLNYSSLRKQTKKRTRERDIQWDRSVASLDLMLPLTIARILDCGRAPVFVIDELDKVDNVDEKLGKLINRLKHIVADNALFCFLVDRAYFERIQIRDRTQSYSREHTYYSERLFVISTPAQWRTYLMGVLSTDDTTSRGAQEILALTFYLLARSKMHAIELVRELTALERDPVTPVKLDLPDLLGDRMYRNLIYVQAVVEYMLENDKLRRRRDRDPHFLQYLYDTLYYLLSRWERETSPDVSRDGLRQHLDLRAMGRN